MPRLAPQRPATGFPKPQNLITVDQLDARFADFLDYAEMVANHSPATLRWYVAAYRNYRKFLLEGNAFVPDEFERRALDLDAWIRWNRGRKMSAVAVNTLWRGLRRFFKDWEVRAAGPNPFRGVKQPAVPRYAPKALGFDVCGRILLAARNFPWSSPFERALALAVLGVMLYAGLRLSEVLHLLCEDVDVNQGTLRIFRGKGRAGGKDRMAYLSPELAALLRDYVRERHACGVVCPEFFASPRKGTGIGVITIRRIVDNVKKASGIHFTPHVLRHCFVTHLLSTGAPIHVVRDLAGHASVTTTMGYLAVFDVDRQAALQNLQFMGSGPPGGGNGFTRPSRRPGGAVPPPRSPLR